MSLIFQGAKFGAWTVRMYLPSGTEEKVKTPCASDCVVRVALDSASWRAIWASGIAEASVSAITPLTVAVAVMSGGYAC